MKCKKDSLRGTANSRKRWQLSQLDMVISFLLLWTRGIQKRRSRTVVLAVQGSELTVRWAGSTLATVSKSWYVGGCEQSTTSWTMRSPLSNSPLAKSPTRITPFNIRCCCCGCCCCFDCCCSCGCCCCGCSCCGCCCSFCSCCCSCCSCGNANQWTHWTGREPFRVQLNSINFKQWK